MFDSLKKALFGQPSSEQSRNDEDKYHHEHREKTESLFMRGIKKLRSPGDEDVLDVASQGMNEETFKRFLAISKEVDEEFESGKPKTFLTKTKDGLTKAKNFLNPKRLFKSKK
jgi:hypothetical protein